MLPIDPHLTTIIDALDRQQSVVLKAPPGAGKTTGVPPAIIDRPWMDGREVWLIQPRRLAARASASRLADLMNTTIGGKVGYQVRFDRQIGPSTRLVAMTTGILLRRLQNDPFLENVSAILLDEFHERSLEMDLSLGMIRRVIEAGRDDLRLMVMSATLAPQPIVDFLENAVGIETEGRSYPVDVRHIEVPPRERLETSITTALERASVETDGDVLVFLPGVGEIRSCAASINERAIAEPFEIRQLYGDQSPQQQSDALARSDRRRVILSTNVAETSVTIDGVTAVIDSGKARVMGFDTKVGLPRLQRQNISIAAADQRAGRAGRTAPGIAYRLWSAASAKGRASVELPEIARTDLTAARLTLLDWGEKDWTEFPFLTPPSPSAIENADQLLVRLGAIEEDQTVTPIGRRIARFPLHPRLGRMMIEAEESKASWPAALVAAMLTSRDPFRSGTGASPIDLFDRLDRLIQFIDGKHHLVANVGAAKNLVRVAKQVHRSAAPGGEIPLGDSARIREALTPALMAAYPDRLCQRRDPAGSAGVMIGRRGVRWSGQAPMPPWFLAIDIDGGGTEAKIRMAVGLDTSDIPRGRFVTRTDHEFDPARQAVVARRRTLIEDLLVSESPTAVKDGPEANEILYQSASAEIDAVLPDAKSAFMSLWSRLRFLNRVMPDADWPPADDAALGEILKDVGRGRTSFDQIRSGPWHDHLVGRLGYDQWQAIESAAPTHFQLPSGNRTSVIYHATDPPRIEARIQELFGLSETPRVAAGRVPLQLHLLSPARRVEQITDDLANFWNATYAQVRKDLRGRYPKHHWPEDPAGAQATPNGLKPRPRKK